VRKQYHLRPHPAGLKAWDIDRLVAMTNALVPESVPLTDIRELDEAYWSSGYDRPLTCREIADHVRLVDEVDLAFPIILSTDGRIMDGMHRVARAYLLGQTHVKAVRFIVDPEPDYVGVSPNDLPYDKTDTRHESSAKPQNQSVFTAARGAIERAEVLQSVCRLIADRDIETAKARSVRDYPNSVASTPRGTWSLGRLAALFARDGFTDRYSGTRLVFPGTLRALSVLLAESFPYHRNWKQSETHPAFWELYPTFDHVIPVARGGSDDESNVVTTSMVRNSAKSNWLLEELGWPLDRAPIVEGWDGLSQWFAEMYGQNELLRADSVARQWYRAGIAAKLFGQRLDK
jgi:hypothetical protein